MSERTVHPAPRMSPRMLRLGALLALGVALLLLPVEYLERGGPDFGVRLFAHVIQAIIALGAIVASYVPVAAGAIDGIALAVVAGIGANVLGYFAVTPSSPGLISNAMTLLLFGGTVICSWTPRRTAFVGTLFAQGFVVTGLWAHPTDVGQDRFVFAIGALLLGSGIAAFCATILNSARESLARREDELEALSNRLMSVQEEERRRLSRELHDGVGQGLTAVVSHLWLLERRLPGSETDLRSQVSEARGLAAKTLAEIRELSQLLRPSLLDDWGLVPSLEAQVKAFRMHHEIDIDLDATELPDRLPNDVETAVYRIVQEALTNVARHAHATNVRVSLQHTDHELRLEVIDNGIGYQAHRDGRGSRGLGLIGIRERVRALGGQVAFLSDRGARLSIVLPLQA